MKDRQIHKGNYEEFFLLYVDNELTAAEKLSVERFLTEHPDLEPELQMLMDTRLAPDTLRFEGKESLFRNAVDIGPWNIGDLQMQWLDDELDAGTAARVEEYTRMHSEAAAEWAQLKQARLMPEPVGFPDKASLYRHASKPAPVLPLFAKRMAAAAAILLAAALFWMNREDVEPGPRVPVSAGVSTTEPSQRDRDPRLIAEEEISAGAKPDAPAAGESTKVEASSVGKLLPDQAVTIAVLDRTQDAATDLPEQKADAPSNVVAISDAAPAPVPTVTEVIDAGEAPALNVKNDYASEALAGEDDMRDRANSVWDDQRHRKGLRGIVRKLNRFYNKATNPDPDRTMVRIASFEIGLPR